MKKELLRHLIPLGLIFVVVSILWLSSKTPYDQYIFLFLGLAAGSFLLDFDHIIYWYFLKPNTDESHMAQSLIKSKQFIKAFRYLDETHQNHTSLIFHHFFFQVALSLISFFIFTLSKNAFILSFILALNIHLLVDEVDDYIFRPKHLQEWLFAREEIQLPIEQVRYYLILFIFFSIFFIYLLISSNL